jgi:hypothetical protein
MFEAPIAALSVVLIVIIQFFCEVGAWPRDGSGCSCEPQLDLCAQLQAAKRGGRPVFAAQILSASPVGYGGTVNSRVVRVFSSAMPTALNLTTWGLDDPCSSAPVIGKIHVIGLPSCGELSPYQPIDTLSMERLRFIETMSLTSIGWTCDHNMSVYAAGYSIMVLSACSVATLCVFLWRQAADAGYFTLDDSREMSSSMPASAAAAHDSSATCSEFCSILWKWCLACGCGQNGSRGRTFLASSRALMVAAAAMSFSQILV